MLRDDYLLGQIRRVHKDHFGVYGPREVWVQLHREGITVARCTVERLMRVAGLEGARRGRTTPTTTRWRGEATADDLLERDFGAAAPNQTWVADLTYVETTSGFCYTALVVDCYARLIVGWAVASHLRAELALDALEMAVWRRGGQALDGLVHHSDKGAQYTALRDTDRLEAAGIAPSVGSTGDAYDNALAESVIALYKTELIEPVKPWSTTADVELATLAYIDWFNNRRILEPIGDKPPAEAEAIHAAATHQPDHTDGTQ